MIKSVNWGLIGAGDIVRKRVAPAFMELSNGRLTAVARGRAELAESFAAEYNIPQWYSRWEYLVNDPAVEAVYIASPVYLHAEQAVAAADAGKHVLCEKPMALNPAECRRMISAASANNVKLGIAYYRRFYPIVKRIKDILNSGIIGQPVLTFVKAFENFNPGPDHPRRWFVEKLKSGGGPMFDFGCHRIEFLINLFGAVSEVESMLGNIMYNRQVEDTASALLRFDKCQAVLSVTHAAYESFDTVEIHGSKGSVSVPKLNGSTLVVSTPEGKTVETVKTYSNVHLPLIEDFTEAVLENRQPAVTAETGLEVNIVLDRIYNKN